MPLCLQRNLMENVGGDGAVLQVLIDDLRARTSQTAHRSGQVALEVYDRKQMTVKRNNPKAASYYPNKLATPSTPHSMPRCLPGISLGYGLKAMMCPSR